MDLIPSFQIDHRKLEPGVYVSRIDRVNGGEVITFDMRMRKPYADSPMDSASMHTIEHLGAMCLRNDPYWKEKTIYFGPMGCRTGFYLIMAGISDDVCPVERQGLTIAKKICSFILDFDGTVPGARPAECGNCFDHNLTKAKRYIKKYYEKLSNSPHTKYPE